MAAGRPCQPNDPGVLASVEMAMRSVAYPNPIVVAWRWRYELALTVVLAAVTFGIVQALGAVWLMVAVVVAAATFALWPGGRQAIIARAWCVITPHRLRTGCAHSWIQSRTGKLPVILRTTAQPFGERVLVWCVAGTSADDLRAVKDALAAACWAADIKISRSDRHAHVVIVDVIRHRPASPPGPEPGRMTWPA